MNLKNAKNSEWEEGYLDNVWCRFKLILSPDEDLFIVAKKNSIMRVFKLEKKLVDEHQHEELNEVMKFAKEISLSKTPKFVRKEVEV